MGVSPGGGRRSQPAPPSRLWGDGSFRATGRNLSGTAGVHTGIAGRPGGETPITTRMEVPADQPAGCTPGRFGSE